MSWVVLSYRLHSDHSRARVAVWREVRRSGALHLQQSLVAFPGDDAFKPAIERFRAIVGEVGGETLALKAEALDEREAAGLIEAWNAARDAEYAELTAECEKFLAEIEHEFEIAKFTDAELDEEEAELDKLERWRERIAARDVHDAAGAEAADGALTRAAGALARYADAVFEHTQAQ